MNYYISPGFHLPAAVSSLPSSPDSVPVVVVVLSEFVSALGQQPLHFGCRFPKFALRPVADHRCPHRPEKQNFINRNFRLKFRKKSPFSIFNVFPVLGPLGSYFFNPSSKGGSISGRGLGNCRKGNYGIYSVCVRLWVVPKQKNLSQILGVF